MTDKQKPATKADVRAAAAALDKMAGLGRAITDAGVVVSTLLNHEQVLSETKTAIDAAKAERENINKEVQAAAKKLAATQAETEAAAAKARQEAADERTKFTKAHKARMDKANAEMAEIEAKVKVRAAEVEKTLASYAEQEKAARASAAAAERALENLRARLG